MMDYRENAGYVITDSCHVGESEFVLGEIGRASCRERVSSPV
mgnify:CR=1 FL=1